ncbi:MAG: glycoside hydrolase family 2 protein, partial [Lachnospiraceae bacterium]|nr:glycoside hydrolase family 2 protein [Lachnospiraceae bacterium]
MKRIDLAGTWEMTGNGYRVSGEIPGSVYSFLLGQGLMPDPFYRDNEDAALALMEHAYTFSRKFVLDAVRDRILLRCEGLDTLATIVLNGNEVAKTENMHRTYEFDVTSFLIPGENEISVTFASPTAYAREMHGKYPVGGTMNLCYSGFYQLRKAHCMFGWDWGPFLPDAGIWRDLYLLIENSARITEAEIRQRHENGRVFVTPEVETTVPCEVRVRLTAPDGEIFELRNKEEFEISEPELWWPNGLGPQPLYDAEFTAVQNGLPADRKTKRIGLRTLRLVREKDPYGEAMYEEVNGVPFFAMGADYIPEDNVFSRITKNRTRRLLQQAKDCHFNTIRVWGGGYYPDDWFYDLCDEMGLVVFQDMMVACCMLPDRQDLIREFEEEVRCNLKRISYHACLGVISGNNEVEEMYVPAARESTEEVRKRYLEIFERIVPAVVREVCPEIAYIPSSPTTCGHFIDPQNENYGDSHYWQVWHQNKPFDDYRQHYFRYLSEFGFQSFPSEKTVEAY